MKPAIRTFVRALPLASGVLLTLMSFTFLLDLSYIDLDDGDFWAFVFSGLIGIPIVFVGIEVLCRDQP
jgi:hypothetical protein